MHSPNTSITKNIAEKLVKAEQWYKTTTVPTDTKKLKKLCEFEQEIIQIIYNETQFAKMQIKEQIKMLQEDLDLLEKISIVTKDPKQRSIYGLSWITNTKMQKRF